MPLQKNGLFINYIVMGWIMTSNYIYIKLCSNESICLNKLKIMVKDECNKIVFDGITDNFGKVKIPICNNKVYKLVIYSNLSIIKIPLIAKKNKIYCINISNNKRKEHLVTVLLKDKYYPNIKIEGGKMILWQDIQSQ